LKKYKSEKVAMIEDFIDWLENLQEDELTIIPPFDKEIDMILRPEKF